MTTHQLTGTLRPTRPFRTTRPSVLVAGVGPALGLAVVPVRRRDTLLARLRSSSLDRSLASGAVPESSRLLATRAYLLTRPAARRSLACSWEALSVRAWTPVRGFDSRVPIARQEVAAAADEITRVASLLRSTRPVSANGVAAARLLLTTANSPVYRTSSAQADLVAALARGLERM